MEKIVKEFFKYIGENPNDKRLIETPKRVKKAVDEIFKGYKENSAEHLNKTFNNPLNKNSFIKEKNIPFYSICEHHLLPFFGKVSIKYMPDKKIVGLSKMSRMVQSYAAKLSLQEKLTNEIANAIKEKLNAKSVEVKIKAYHLCISMRGIKATPVKTITKTIL